MTSGQQSATHRANRGYGQASIECNEVYPRGMGRRMYDKANFASKRLQAKLDKRVKFIPKPAKQYDTTDNK